MAATGALADVLAAITTNLTTAGYRVTLDPRAVTPKSVLVQLPRFTAYNGNVLDVVVDLQVVGTASMDTANIDWLLTAAADIHADGNIAILSGDPITLIVGQQELPAYQFTVRFAHTRNP